MQDSQTAFTCPKCRSTLTLLRDDDQDTGPVCRALKQLGCDVNDSRRKYPNVSETNLRRNQSTLKLTNHQTDRRIKHPSTETQNDPAKS